MADAGAAVVIPDGELSGARLAREVAALLADRARLAGDGGGLARPGAARGRAGGGRRAARRRHGVGTGGAR